MHKFLHEIVRCNIQALVPPGAIPQRGTYHVKCPLCEEKLDEHEKKLYIKEDFSMGHCFRCESKFFPPDGSNSKRFDYRRYKPTQDTGFTLERIDCSYYWEAQEESQSGIDYLISRDPWYRDHYKELGLRFYDDRVVIPFFYNGNVVYYQSRFIDQNRKARYHVPPSTNKPLYVCPISDLNSTRVILCEGVFGAIATARRFPSCKVVAILGSHVTKYQKFLLSGFKITEFVLYFDMENINLVVKKELLNNFSSVPIRTIDSPLGDPEDDLKFGKAVSIGESSGGETSDVSFAKELFSHFKNEPPHEVLEFLAPTQDSNLPKS